MKTRLLVLLFIAIQTSFFAQQIEGELRKWHKITISADLPNTTLNESASTFRNHRMDVVFTDPNGEKIRVPGYFAADGDAANSSAKQGQTFKAHLRPYMTGTWNYEILYYTGNNVALQNVNQLPSPAKRLTGSVGNISGNNKSEPDLRAKGRLTYRTSGSANSRRYLQFAQTGEYLFKIGPDSPENMLDFNDFDFDANRNNCGLCKIHSFNPHAAQFNNGPTWKNGKGKNIIGALNYIKQQGMNSFSMSLFGGDDKNVFPWVNLGDKFRFDISKLEQWEIVFDHAEKIGLMMHYKLAENENWDALNDNELRVQYREMVARFGHHLAIEWNISEEYRGSAQSAISRIDFLAAIDPWQNHRVIHTYPGEHDKYDDWLSLNAKLTGASIQSAANANDAFNGRSGILTWINKSRNANIPWVVSSDEQNTGKTGVFTDEKISTKSVRVQARTHYLWKNLIAGGQGVMWYGGSKGDFETENFNRFEILFDWSKYAFDFFKGNQIPYWNMRNNDNLVSGNNNHALVEAGKYYVIYLEKGGNPNLNLNGANGNYNIKWFDPRNGGNLKNGSITQISGGGNRNIGNPPNNTGNDWVALVTNTNNTVPDVTDPGNDPDTGDCSEKVFEENNGVIAVEAEDFIDQEKTNVREWFVIENGTTGTPTPDPDANNSNGASGGKYIEILPDTRVTHGDPLTVGTNFSNTPGALAIVNYKVNFSTTGKYFVWVRAYSTGTEDNGVHVGIDGQWPTSGARMQWCAGKNAWTWESKQRTDANHCGEEQKIFLNVNTPGIHTVSFSMREDGFEMDKFILSKTFVKPIGTGTDAIIANCDDDPDDGGNNGNPDNGNDDECQGIVINPINDAYLQGGAGSLLNNNDLRVESNNRVSYLQFQTPNTPNGKSISSTTLELTVSSDSGSGLIEIFKGNSSNWNENNLSNSNKPTEDGLLGSLNTNYTIGQTYTWNLQDLPAGQTVSLIVKQTGGNDVSFSASEGTNSPKLTITHTCDNDDDDTPDTGGDPDTGNDNCEDTLANPINDAYLQGGASSLLNNNDLRVESNNRVSYLQFQTPNIPNGGSISSTMLELTVSSDSGSGLIEIFKGSSSNWNENNLSNSNKPSEDGLLGSLNTNYVIGQTYTWELQNLPAGQTVSLIVKQTGGNDVSFSASEGNNSPVLIIKYNCDDTLGNDTPVNVDTFVIEAESFSNTSGTFNDTAFGGSGLGANKADTIINYVNENDYVDYPITILEEGVYKVTYYISSPVTGSSITFGIPDLDFNTTTVPNNNSWDDFQKVEASQLVFFTAQNHTIRLTATGSMWTWNLDKFSLEFISASKDLIQKPVSDNISIYPLPAISDITISGISNGLKNITVYSLAGAIVLNTTVESTEGFTTLDVSSLSTGIYLLTIDGKNHKLVIK